MHYNTLATTKGFGIASSAVFAVAADATPPPPLARGLDVQIRATSATGLATKICGDNTSGSDRQELFARLLALDASDRALGLRHIIMNGNADFAYDSALIFLQMNGQATVDLLLPRIADWPTQYQKGILDSMWLRQSPSLAISLATVLVDAKPISIGPSPKLHDLPTVPEIAALYLVSNRRKDLRAIAHRKLERYPQLRRLWLALLLRGEITEIERSVALGIFSDESLPVLRRLGASVVLFEADAVAKEYCKKVISEFLAEYSGRSTREIIVDYQANANWRTHYLEYQLNLEVVGMLRFVPEDFGSELTFKYLTARNADIRNILGLVAAKRWPTRLLNEYEDAFPNTDFRALRARIATWHPGIAIASYVDTARETVVRDERLQSSIAASDFNPDVISSAWWAR